jgi:hypothetical protein
MLNILLLIALCLASYCRTYDVPFVFDDFATIKHNPLIQDFSNFFNRGKAFAVFSENPQVLKDTLNSFYTRPISYLTFAVNYRLHGLALAGYHIVNTFIHILNVISVYLLVLLISNKAVTAEVDGDREDSRRTQLIAFFTAALFAVHPVMTNAVTYIIQRMTSLVALFYLGSVLLYACSDSCEDKTKKRTSYALALISCCVAMLTKESAFTIPLMLLLYEATFAKDEWWRRIVRVAPFFVSMAIIPLNLLGLDNAETSPAAGALSTSLNLVNFQKLSWWEYLLTQFRVVAFYLKILIAPFGLSLDHDFSISRSMMEPEVLLSMALHLCLFSYGFYLIRAARKGSNSILDRLAGFGVLWFYVALLVESSVIPLNAVAVEYRTYLPSLGIFLFAVCLTFKLSGKVPHGMHRRFPFVWLPVICLLMGLTVARNETWRDPEKLWKQTIELYPKLPLPYANLADIYISRGNLSDAVRVYKQSIQEIPNEANLHYELGIVYLMSREYEAAIAELSQAVTLNPEMKKGYERLAQAYLYTGRQELALQAIGAAEQLGGYRP